MGLRIAQFPAGVPGRLTPHSHVPPRRGRLGCMPIDTTDRRTTYCSWSHSDIDPLEIRWTLPKIFGQQTAQRSNIPGSCFGNRLNQCSPSGIDETVATTETTLDRVGATMV